MLNPPGLSGEPIAIRDEASIHMPPRILAVELGVVALHLLATLDA